ncbi:hypothetical protein K491DRAFT_216418 [Lophiostoma macrostomum CBS 122681]|uniref:Uncharacterized protein n=1 Tax=Lophiostoma macrostomum CBS 122681 TaxID=1314788 RepID=A0A6A6TIW5_9PLEO|nr:hypothetical protein K491DRAFT_216418 [Lophiostoma macrostomum CBS 122681]
MAYSRLFAPRNLAFFSVVSLGGTYAILKSRTLAAKQNEKAAGDYSVSVDRSGAFSLSTSLGLSWQSKCC